MALRRAAESGNVEKVKDLLSRKVDVHEREKYGGYTALHYAANVGVARLLLEAHADAEEKSFAGTTPLQLAQRRGCADLVRLLQTARVDEPVRRARLEVKRQAAADDLAKALMSRGVPDMAALETLPPEVSVELRQDERLRKLIVRASAVQEAEVLLGLKPATLQRPHARLVKQLQADSYDEVRRVLEEEESSVQLLLMQRDPHGNIPAHHCRSVLCYRLLMELAPESAEVRNKLGQTPLECLLEHPTPEAIKELWCGFVPAPSGPGDDRVPLGPDAWRLLRLDGSGVSLVMRTHGKVREWLLEEQLAQWDDFQRLFKLPESLPDSLNKLAPEGHWREVLAVHLFGEPEVWRDGRLTPTCTGRLEELWSCIKLLLQRVLRRSPESEAAQSMAAAEALLRASRGPRRLPDAREPYRKELSLEMLHLSAQSEAIHGILWDMEVGQAASWLRAFPDDHTWEAVDPFNKCKPDASQRHRHAQKMRLDFRLAAGGKHLASPSWSHTNMSFDLGQVLKDLRHVGGKDLRQCLGEESFGDTDAVFRMLEGAHGFGPDAFPKHLAELCEPAVAFWHAAWIRGLCQSKQEALLKNLVDLLHTAEPAPVVANGPDDAVGTVFGLTSAMPLPELCGRALQEMHEIYAEFQEAGGAAADPELEESVNRLLTQSAAFALDVNTVTIIREDSAGIVEAYNLLKSSPGGILQVQNTFHRRAPKGDENRRLKVWVPVKADKHGPLLVEVTLMLTDDYRENRWQRLPLLYFRGAFDDHVRPERPAMEALEKYTKCKFQLRPALIPESKSKVTDEAADQETERKMRELRERKAREAERLAQEEARRKREELERKLREASADFDPSQCVTVGNLTFRPPVEVLPKTKRCEEQQMRKLELYNKKKEGERKERVDSAMPPVETEDEEEAEEEAEPAGA